MAAPAAAQRGCSWYDMGDLGGYWKDPLMHNIPYDGRLVVARVWYSGFFAFCAASAPYGNEFSVGYAHDFPHPEENLAQMINALSKARMYSGGNIIRFDDPEIFKYPIAYLTEPGGWHVTAAEARGARNYLTKGGFLIIDDWRGPDATRNAWAALRAIFPNGTPMRVPDTHPIFNSFFRIENASRLLSQSDNNMYGRGEYWGIYEGNDPNGRLMVICDVNADVKDYWVWSSRGMYPIDMSNDAYKLGINYLIYALVH